MFSVRSRAETYGQSQATQRYHSESTSIYTLIFKETKPNGDGEGNSYLINRLVVKFTDKVEAEEIFIDHQNGRVILEAPHLPKGSKETESDRRMYYFNNLIRSVEAIATIGISHIYLVLDEDGRKELELTKAPKKKSKKAD